MLFNPVEFHGRTIPGLYELSRLLPRKLQEVPGIMQGGIGWQGIVPARAAKMGSISVDKAIAKLGTPAEFFQELGPDQIAEQMVVMFEPRLPEIVDRIMRQEQPLLWQNVPDQAKQAIYSRVQQQLPEIMHTIIDEIRPVHRPADRPEADGDRPLREAPGAGQQDLQGFRCPRAPADGQLRLPVRLPARDPGGGDHPLRDQLVAAATARRGRRLDDQPARHVGDLRAGRAAQDRALHAARAVPAPPDRRRPRYTRGSSPRT